MFASHVIVILGGVQTFRRALGGSSQSLSSLVRPGEAVGYVLGSGLIVNFGHFFGGVIYHCRMFSFGGRTRCFIRLVDYTFLARLGQFIFPVDSCVDHWPLLWLVASCCSSLWGWFALEKIFILKY